jgi:hypothetical protein
MTNLDGTILAHEDCMDYYDALPARIRKFLAYSPVPWHCGQIAQQLRSHTIGEVLEILMHNEKMLHEKAVTRDWLPRVEGYRFRLKTDPVPKYLRPRVVSGKKDRIIPGDLLAKPPAGQPQNSKFPELLGEADRPHSPPPSPAKSRRRLPPSGSSGPTAQG